MKEEILKPLGADKIFKFEFDIQGNQIRVGLKEINVYTPYYYEDFFSLEDLKGINSAFGSCASLEGAKGHLSTLMKRPDTYLESLNDDKEIKICFKMYEISILVDESFKLERKTVEEEKKDEALMKLFEIQTKNIDAFRQIEIICEEEKNRNNKVAQKILKLLKN